jgi:hypothetical protein
MACKPRYTAKQVADALTETKGMMFIAAQRLGCTHQTIRNYCARYPSVREVVEAQKGQMVDLAELKLWQSIQNGEAWGITLCLKTIGKDRGYVERQELTGENSGPLTLRVVYEDVIDVTPEPLRLAIEMPQEENGTGNE